MDLKMNAEKISFDKNPIWDVKVVEGIVPIIWGEEEDMQGATLACFLERGLVKQLPHVGVPWSEFLTKKITFGEVYSAVRQSIADADKSFFMPSYDIENEKLTIKVGKQEER